MRKRHFFALMFLIMSCISHVQYAQSQSLNETLENLGRDVATAYVKPIVSGFGADLNSGWMYRAPKATKFGFDFDFGFVVMGAFMPDDAKKINESAQFQFEPSIVDQITSSITDPTIRANVRNHFYNNPITVTVTGATIVGAKTDSLRAVFTGGNYSVTTSSGPYTVNLNPANITLPVGGLLEDISLLPFVAPQFSVGTVYGTKLAFRYLPEIEVDKKIGKFNYFGFGIQHNPFMWLPVSEPPVDVSLGFFTQSMKVGSILETRATMFGVQASKTYGPGALNVTPYAGLSLESSKMTITYTFNAPNPIAGQPPVPTPISFELDGENSARLTLGVSFKLAIIKLNADYNISKFNSLSAGLGFII